MPDRNAHRERPAAAKAVVAPAKRIVSGAGSFI
jgi:hypothetical protein